MSRHGVCSTPCTPLFAPGRTWWTGGSLTAVLIIVWPLLSLPAGVFNRGYFHMWVILAITWGLVAAFIW